MRIPELRAVVSYLLLLGSGFFIPFSFPKSVTDDKGDKSKLIPDFCQTDETHGKLPYGGWPFCGPTSASNLLLYLDRTRFPNMLSQESPTLSDQQKLIEKLGSKEYMCTGEYGTGTNNLISGLEKYVRERGYKINVQCNGYPDCNRKYNRGNSPNPAWLKEKVDNGYEAILRIGYYYQYPDGSYWRYSGHYVTFVGYKGSDPNEILVHDSSRTNKKDTESKTEQWKLIPDEAGYWKIDRGKERTLESTDVYLDGVIVFKVDNN